MISLPVKLYNFTLVTPIYSNVYLLQALDTARGFTTLVGFILIPLTRSLALRPSHEEALQGKVRCRFLPRSSFPVNTCPS